MTEKTTENGQKVAPAILVGPLPIWPILRDAVLIVWQNRGQVFRLILIPVFLLTIFEYFELRLMGIWDSEITELTWLDLERMILWGGTAGIVLTNFAVHCHRLVLVPSYEIGLYGVKGWTKGEVLFLIWLFFGFLGGIVGAFPFLIFGFGISEYFVGIENFPEEYFTFLINISLLPIAYILGRLSLIFPAVAIGLRPSLRMTWGFTKGNGWRLAFLIWIVPTAFYDAGFYEMFNFVFGENGQQVVSNWGVIILKIIANSLSFLAYSIEIAILSLCFKELSWWNGPRLEKSQATASPL